MEPSDGSLSEPYRLFVDRVWTSRTEREGTLSDDRVWPVGSSRTDWSAPMVLHHQSKDWSESGAGQRFKNGIRQGSPRNKDWIRRPRLRQRGRIPLCSQRLIVSSR